MDRLNWIFINLHLIVSVLIVVPTAIIYGSPLTLPNHLDIQIDTIDLSNMLKAITGLYLGVSVVWIVGMWKSKYWKSATQLNVLFMLSLAAGRGLSMIVDGIPTSGFVFGILAESLIGFYAVYQLRKHAI